MNPEDVEFWERWAGRLHPDEVKAVVDGDIGIIKRPLEPTWQTGEWMKLRSNFWIKPASPKFVRSARGVPWRISYAIRDYRVRLVKRVPSMFDPPDTDDEGYPIEHDKEAIKAATEDGNYTAAQALAVSECGEAVPPEYDNVIAMQARERFAQHRETERYEETAKRDIRALSSQIREVAITMAKAGVNPQPFLADIQRRIEAQRQTDKAA